MTFAITSTPDLLSAMQMDVDQYRQVRAVRDTPLPGRSSFFEEQLHAWTDQVTAQHWSDASRSLEPMCRSMPLLLHHKDKIFAILRDGLVLDAKDSLEAFGTTIGALARDLQEDFVPYIAPTAEALADLLESGGDREPSALRAVFSCLGLMIKYLVKVLATRIPDLLSCTTRLRYSNVEHVRSFAGEALAYLLRSSRLVVAKQTIKAILQEHAAAPTEARTHGAAVVLSEAITGPQNTLHSRAEEILHQIMDDWQTSEHSEEKTMKGGFHTLEQVRARVAAVLDAVLFRVLEHVRVEHADPLWKTTMQVARDRLTAAEQALLSSQHQGTSIDPPTTPVAVALRHAGRAVAVLAQMTEHRGGQRVRDFAHLVRWLDDLGRGSLFQEAAVSNLPSHGLTPHTLTSLYPSWDHRRYLGVRLSGQVLRLVSAVVGGWARFAKGEMTTVVHTLTKSMPGWTCYFTRRPGRETVDFCREILGPIGRPATEAARVFGPVLLGAVGGVLMHGSDIDASTDMGTWPADVFALENERGHAYCLLADICHALSPGVDASATDSRPALPVILTARPGGRALAAWIQTQARRVPNTVIEARAAWAALRVLPFAVSRPQELMTVVTPLTEKYHEMLTRVVETSPDDIDNSQHSISTDDLLLLLAEVTALSTGFYAASGEFAEVEELVRRGLSIVQNHPSKYHAHMTAIVPLEAYGQLSSTTSSMLDDLAPLARILPWVERCLDAPSQSLRRSTLRLLCACGDGGGDVSGSTDLTLKKARPDAIARTSLQVSTAWSGSNRILRVLHAIEDRTSSLENGRISAAALAGLANDMEYARIPTPLWRAVTASLVGVMHIRFSVLWKPAGKTLAAAVSIQPDVAWGVIARHVTVTQHTFLTKGVGNASGEAVMDAMQLEMALRRGQLPSNLTERHALLRDRGEVRAAGGCTDPATRLGSLLTSMAQVNGDVLRVHFGEWSECMIGFMRVQLSTVAGFREELGEGEAGERGKESDLRLVGLGNAVSESDRDEDENGDNDKDDGTRSRRDVIKAYSGREWRQLMKEWLEVLASTSGIHALSQARRLRAMVVRLCGDVDQNIQISALRALRSYKVFFLGLYMERLLKLADQKTLRGTMLAFRITRTEAADAEARAESKDAIRDVHREGLIPILTRVLFAKIRKRTGRLAGRGSVGSARTSILNYLAGLEPEELRTLFELFLEPLAEIFVLPSAATESRGRDVMMQEQEEGTRTQLVPVPWWSAALPLEKAGWWLRAVDLRRLTQAPQRRRVGFLHAFGDLLGHLGHRIIPFMPAMLAILLRMLQLGCSSAAMHGSSDGHNSAADLKELRLMSLRLLADVLRKLPEEVDFAPFWPMLFDTIQPLLSRLAADASASRPPAVLDVLTALAQTPALLDPLADGAGRAALEATLDLLVSPTASPESLAATLGLVEALLVAADMSSDPLAHPVLTSHVSILLHHLRVLITGSAPTVPDRTPDSDGVVSATPVKKKLSKGAFRELSILERLGPYAADEMNAVALADALISLLKQRDGRGRAALARNGRAAGRTLAAVGAVLSGLHAAQSVDIASLDADSRPPVDEYPGLTRRRLLDYTAVIAPLFGSLKEEDARGAASRVFTAVGLFLPEMQEPSSICANLMAMRTNELDTVDYETRLAAFKKITESWWCQISTSAATPVLFNLLYELRRADDLALRQSAADAISRLVGAMHGNAKDTLEPLRGRILIPQLRAHIAASSLAVRQEHVALFRTLVLTWPLEFPDLKGLVTSNEDQCFMYNVVHLQLSRRIRAVNRLARRLRGEEALREEKTEADVKQTKMEADADESPSTLSEKALFKPGTVVGIFLPLLQQMIVEGKSEEGGVAMKTKDADRDANVVEAAVQCLRAVAESLSWTQYENLLMRYLKLLGAKRMQSGQKKVLRAVCAILDGFHFLQDVRETVRPKTDTAIAAAREVAAREAEAMSLDPSVTCHSVGTPLTRQGGAVEEEDEDDDEEVGTDVEEGENMVIQDAAISRRLLGTVLPVLRSQLVHEDVVRAPVGLAIVKLLKLLPRDAEAEELPKALSRVTQVLRSRSQHIRDDARRVFGQICGVLGPYYMPFVAQTLAQSLPAKGYTAHVLGHAVHTALDCSLKGAEGGFPGPSGCLDEAVEVLLPLIDAELFGDVADAKEVAKIKAQFREAKSSKGTEALYLLAAAVTFHEHIGSLLDLVRLRLPQATKSASIHNKLAILLQHISRGVLENPSLTATGLAEFTYATLQHGCAADAEARAAAAAKAGGAGLSQARKDKERLSQDRKTGSRGVAVHARAVPGTRALIAEAAAEAAHESEQAKAARLKGRGNAADAALAEIDRAVRLAMGTNGHLFVDFSLTLLLAGMRKGPLQGRDARTLGLLDPFVRIMVDVMGLRNQNSVLAGLRVMSTLVLLPLPALAEETGTVEAAGRALTSVLKSSVKTTAPLALEGLRLMTAMLRSVKAYQPTTQQLRFVLRWAFTDLEEHTERGTVFSLFRALVDRRIVIPEVYDAADRIQELLIRSQSQLVRQDCAGALLHYLMDFPVGQTRLDGHLTFLLANLAYEHEDGRLAVLQMLNTVLSKFPPAALAPRSDLIYVPLVGRLANDTRPACQTAVGRALEVLLTRIPRPDVDRSFAMALAWMAKADARLQRTGVQLVGIFVKAAVRLKDNKNTLYACVEEGVTALLLVMAAAAEAEYEADGSHGKGAWHAAYLALVSLEQVLSAVPDFATRYPDVAPVAWETVAELVGHQHTWIRRGSARIIGLALAQPEAREQVLADEVEGAKAHRLALAFFLQLQAPNVELQVCDQAVKCLVSLLPDMHDHVVELDQVEQEQDDDEEIEASHGGSGPGENGLNHGQDRGHPIAALDNSEDNEEARPTEEEAWNPQQITPATNHLSNGGGAAITLHGLMRRMSKLAADGRLIRRTPRMLALRFLAAAATKLGPSRFDKYLELAVGPLVRLADTSISAPGEARALAEEVTAHLRSVCGATRVVEAWSRVSAAIGAKRRERKRDKVLQAVNAPEDYARMKKTKHERKRRGEAAKMAEIKRRKTAGIPLGDLKKTLQRRNKRKMDLD